MVERNSEKGIAIAAAVVSALTGLLVAAAASFDVALPAETVAGIVAGLLGVVWSAERYIDSRPKKHLAMAARERAANGAVDPTPAASE